MNLNNLKENTTHGDFILPIKTYSGELNTTFPSIPIHWHEELEVVLITEGCCYYKLDLSSYILNKGDILIISSQKLHSFNVAENKEMKWSSFVFNVNMLKSSTTDGALLKYISPIINHQHDLPTIIREDNKIYDKLFNAILDIINCYNKKEIAYELEIKSLLYNFFVLLYRNALIKTFSNNKLSSETTDKIKLVLNYINENYNKEISISTLAEICNYSEYHFMRFFKKHIGVTCIKYINNYKLEKSALLLLSSSKSIMEISLDVGFDNLSYFNKLFKRKYNLTPKEFRLKNNTL